MAGDDPQGDSNTKRALRAEAATVPTPNALRRDATANGDTFDQLLADVAATPSVATRAATRPRGQLVERYVILDHLGAGGMGTVYQAYDPNLDRRVALKFLVDAPGSGARTDSRGRLLREAQALAQLSHPNVVAVHDVGVVDDEVFVAMEFVEGTPLDKWITGDRDWRDTVAVFTECGRGLAAAHRRGIVHRDFKPANVIVGADGRARVLDFGLAHAEDSEEHVSRSELERGGNELRGQLTVTGAVMGTPAFMAPEQFLGGRTDGRTDQFAFAVSLFKALYGRMPFDGVSFEQLSNAVRNGEIRDVPVGHGVPGRIHRVIVRALSAEPKYRFGDMDELLEALAHDPTKTRARLMAGFGVVALTGVAIFGLLRGGANPVDTMCKAAGDKLTAVWDEPVQQSIADRFAKLRPSSGAATYQLLATRLHTYTDGWVRMHTAACQASRVRGEESPLLMDRRMACLDRRLGRLRALTSLLGATADASVVDQSVAAVVALPSLSRCADAKALLAAIPPPEDEQTVAAVAALRRRLDNVQALTNAGQYKKALPLAEAISHDAAKVGYVPFTAKSQHAEAQLFVLAQRPQAAEKTMRAAIKSAAVAGDHRLVARGWLRLVGVLGNLRAQHAAGLSLESVASTAIAQAGGAPMLTAELSSRVATVLNASGDLNRAIERFRLARAQYKKAAGVSHPMVSTMLYRIGGVLRRQGKFDAAMQSYTQSLKMRIRIFGINHPHVADSYNGIGLVLNAQGKSARARIEFERALKIRKATLGDRHVKVATALNNLGLVAWAAGSYNKAVTRFAESERIWANAIGKEHPNVAIPMANRGSVLAKLKRYDEARTHLQRAQAQFVRGHGAKHPRVAGPLFKLGYLALDEHKFVDAVAYCTNALSLLEPKRGPNHPYIAYALLCVGQGELGRSQASAAVRPLERGLRILTKIGANPDEIAEACFALARALWITKQDRNRAVELATRAKKITSAKNRNGDLHAKATAWLVKRRR